LALCRHAGASGRKAGAFFHAAPAFAGLVTVDRHFYPFSGVDRWRAEQQGKQHVLPD